MDIYFVRETEAEHFTQVRWPSPPRVGEIVDLGVDSECGELWFRVLQVVWVKAQESVAAEVLVEDSSWRLMRPPAR